MSFGVSFDPVRRDLMLAFQITECRSIEVGSAASAAEQGWMPFGVFDLKLNLDYNNSEFRFGQLRTPLPYQ